MPSSRSEVLSLDMSSSLTLASLRLYTIRHTQHVVRLNICLPKSYSEKVIIGA